MRLVTRTGMRIGMGLCLAASSLALATAAQAQDTPAETPADQADDGEDEIVVTGFRQSLGAAINVKRNSVSSVDAIVAEDIAKFPDQNLAESLQRIPGISIQRDGGEGRAITVRGLGSQFTRVRVNGLETIATSHDGASSNRDRAFDFNVFASELFTSIVVHKTAEARSGQVVVERLGDEVTVKRLKRRGREIVLLPQNAAFAPIEVDPARTPFAIEGIGVGLVRAGRTF